MAFDDYFKKKEKESAQAQTGAPQVDIPKAAAPVDMSWWQDTKAEQEERRLQKEQQALAERQEREARRNRNIALLGDLANIFGQSYAKSGGAWMMDKQQPHVSKANARLQQITEGNLARGYLFAERMAAARQKDKQNAMSREQMRLALQHKANQEAFDRAVEERKKAQEVFSNNMKVADFAAQQDYRAKTLANQRERNAIAARSSQGTFFDVVDADGNKKRFSRGEHGVGYIKSAYQELLKRGMPPIKVKKNWFNPILEDYNPQVHLNVSDDDLAAYMSEWMERGASPHLKDRTNSQW